MRELDTRVGAIRLVLPDATLTAGQTLTLPGSFTFGGITVPAGAKALVGNATVANDGNGTPAGFATFYPDGVALPLASNLNFVAKQVAPNAVVVGIGGDGKLQPVYLVGRRLYRRHLRLLLLSRRGLEDEIVVAPSAVSDHLGDADMNWRRR